MTPFVIAHNAKGLLVGPSAPRKVVRRRKWLMSINQVCVRIAAIATFAAVFVSVAPAAGAQKMPEMISISAIDNYTQLSVTVAPIRGATTYLLSGNGGVTFNIMSGMSGDVPMPAIDGDTSVMVKILGAKSALMSVMSVSVENPLSYATAKWLCFHAATSLKCGTNANLDCELWVEQHPSDAWCPVPSAAVTANYMRKYYGALKLPMALDVALVFAEAGVAVDGMQNDEGLPIIGYVLYGLYDPVSASVPNTPQLIAQGLNSIAAVPYLTQALGVPAYFE